MKRGTDLGSVQSLVVLKYMDGVISPAQPSPGKGRRRFGDPGGGRVHMGWTVRQRQWAQKGEYQGSPLSFRQVSHVQVSARRPTGPLPWR